MAFPWSHCPRPWTRTQISEVGGSFAYTFGYAALSPIVDGGFEQPTDVANVTGGFLHGPQLSPPGGDQPWTFTDASSTDLRRHRRQRQRLHEGERAGAPGPPGWLHPGNEQHQPDRHPCERNVHTLGPGRPVGEEPSFARR